MPLDPIATWLVALERNPKQAVADLLSGRLDRGQFARLECAEFMQRALADAAAEAHERLDEGLAEWLAEAQTQDGEWRRRDGLQAHLYRLNEAFAAIGLLDLPRTAYRLRELSPAYRRWLQGYDYGYGDGPYAGYWRALASTQKDTAPFRRQWHDFVVHAGGARYPAYLFQIGMAGLRRLPGDAEQRQLATIHALLVRAWRLDTDTALTDFAERLSALRAEYPMCNDTWRGRTLRVLQLLEEDVAAQRQRLPRAWQARDAARLEAFKAGLGEVLKPVVGDLNLGQATAQSVSLPALPSFDEGKRLEQALRNSHPRAVADSLGLFERHRAYAEASGDAYFFVRTLCNLGHRILKQPGLEHSTLESLRALLRHALAWEPGNDYPWNLWAELEQAEGREDVAEAVLWEAVRRFPYNAPSRGELALLLQRRFERERTPVLLAEAEQVLREAVDTNPLNAPSRVELALLLQRRYERERTPVLLAEAEQMLREVVNANPRNSHSRTELARLLARNGRSDQALALLQEGLASKADTYWQRMLDNIEAGKPLPLPKLDTKQVKRAQHPAAPATAEMDNALRANAAAARFAYARERGETPDSANLRSAAHVYALPRFTLGWFGLTPVEPEQDGPRPPYALAALAALADPDRWPQVENHYPAHAHDTVLLKLYAGIQVTVEARAELAQWLEEPETSEPDAEAEAGEDAPAIGNAATYDDFLRRRLRKLDFLNAGEQTSGGLATATRSGDFDRLIERNLARTIEADLPPIALAA